jgi:hypothetical protein
MLHFSQQIRHTLSYYEICYAADVTESVYKLIRDASAVFLID